MRVLLRRADQAGLLCVLGLLAACASDTTGPVVSNDVPYWQLRLNYHAVTLALTPHYDTIQLVATPVNATGVPLSDTGTTTYTVSSTKVHVDSIGVLHADSVVSNLKLYASRTVMGVTWRDSVLVTVTNVSRIPVLGSLTLSGTPTSCPIGLSTCRGQMRVTVKDSSGATISPVALAFSSGDGLFTRGLVDNVVTLSTTATVMTVRPFNVGQVMLYAEATVYGRTLRDSLLFTVGNAVMKCVYVRSLLRSGQTDSIGTFDPGTVTIAAGGTVLWVNEFTGHTADVVFDDPSAVFPGDSVALGSITPKVVQACATFGDFYNVFPNDGLGGSIPTWPAMVAGHDDGLGIRARIFPTAGTYPYHSAEYGTSGTVIVLPQ